MLFSYVFWGFPWLDFYFRSRVSAVLIVGTRILPERPGECHAFFSENPKCRDRLARRGERPKTVAALYLSRYSLGESGRASHSSTSIFACSRNCRMQSLPPRADVAQLVEQRFRKPQVTGSNPVVGSSLRLERSVE